MRSKPTIGILLTALLLLPSCHRADPPAVAPVAGAIKVRVALVELSTDLPAVRTAGLLARQTEADLSFPFPGLLATVAVRAGDRVKSGQELARLQPELVEAILAQAQATLDKARRDLTRVERLQTDRVATLENLQDARTVVTQAEAALRVAEFNRSHATLVAPADGVVLRRLAEPNELVTAGHAVLAFAGQSDGWIARVGLSARDLSVLTAGARAAISDGAGHTASAHVTQIGEAADAATRTVPVEILLESPLPGARSGLVVTVVITPPAIAPRAAVPVAALREGRGLAASLFLLTDGASTVKRVSVEIEQVDGARAYLRTALPVGARVVIAGGQFLSDGATVRIAN